MYTYFLSHRKDQAMDTKTMFIQWTIMLILVVALTFGLQAIQNNKNGVTGETQSVLRWTDEHFTPCTLSQGMLIGKQPLFIYQNTETKQQWQLQAVKVAAGIINDQPVCKYYNSQSKNIFSIILPGTFTKERCKVENSDRIWFICENIPTSE